MDYFSSMQISETGLIAEKMRLEAVALNLANANTTSAPGVARTNGSCQPTYWW